jgi:integrase/recombinase XerD
MKEIKSAAARLVRMKSITWNGEARIALVFPYDQELIKVVKEMPGRRWDAEEKYWHVPENADNLDYIYDYFPHLRPADYWHLDQERAVRAFRDQLQLERKAYRTIKGYMAHFRRFLEAYGDRDPNELTIEDAKAHIVQITRERNLAVSTQNQIINALKYFFERVKSVIGELFY